MDQEKRSGILEGGQETLDKLLRPQPNLFAGMPDGPKTSEEGKKLLMETMMFKWYNAKQSKKDLAEFITYYNSHKSEINLDEREIQALKKLREMWNQVTRTTSFDFFVKMKEQHTVLNGRLLCGITGPKNELWQKYILNFQSWRSQSGLSHFHIMKSMMANQPGSTNSKEGASKIDAGLEGDVVFATKK